MTTAEACREHDLTCYMDLEPDDWEVRANSHIDFVRLAARVDWRNIMKRKLDLELRMSLQ